MIATGTDIKPLECVFFMRDVRSAQYYEQMKGRGARTIEPADFQAVTPDATQKTRFVIVDAVGVTEHDFVEPPLNRDKNASLEKLLKKTANLTITEAETATLASRLAALELQLTPEERAELDGVAGGSMRDVVRGLVDAVDPDVQARAVDGSAEPSTAIDKLLEQAIEPLAANPDLRERILELRRSHDRVIDEVSVDVLLDAYGVVNAEKARSTITSFKEYLEQHRNEITAIQLMSEARERRIEFADIKELADRIARPPYNWTTDVIWTAYATIEIGRVRHSDRRTLTDLVSLLRFTLGDDNELVPYATRVQERYAGWLAQQEQTGVVFSRRERWWIDNMAEVIAASAGITPADLDQAPFTERGGIDGALRDLGDRTATVLEQLNTQLTA